MGRIRLQQAKATSKGLPALHRPGIRRSSGLVKGTAAGDSGWTTPPPPASSGPPSLPPLAAGNCGWARFRARLRGSGGVQTRDRADREAPCGAGGSRDPPARAAPLAGAHRPSGGSARPLPPSCCAVSRPKPSHESRARNRCAFHGWNRCALKSHGFGVHVVCQGQPHRKYSRRCPHRRDFGWAVASPVARAAPPLLPALARGPGPRQAEPQRTHTGTDSEQTRMWWSSSGPTAPP